MCRNYTNDSPYKKSFKAILGVKFDNERLIKSAEQNKIFTPSVPYHSRLAYLKSAH